MEPLHNKDAAGVWIGSVIAFLGLVAVAIPGLIGLDMMHTGFGMMCMGSFVIIIGLVTTVVFWQRAREMNRILANENILARWTFDETQSHQQIQDEFSRLNKTNRVTYLIVAAWFVVIGGVLLGIDLIVSGEFNWVFALFFYGILVFLGLVAWITPILWHRQALHSSREVIIARNGLVLNGALHTWVAPLNRLESVRFNTGSGENTLEFEIRYLTRASITLHSSYIVSVPVPAGKETLAQQTLEYFQNRKDSGVTI
ncbi:MAG TPA: hypothetical protein VF338_08895 [Leptolinea sp.]